MELARLRHVYEYDGPFATVYLEGRSPSEDAAHQTRLRWEALREKLADQDAAESALEAIDSALQNAESGEAQGNGRVLVATEAGLVLDEAWDAALGTGDAAHWTVLPELGAYVREEARSVRMLVAVVDQEGAKVRQEVVATEHVAREVEDETVQGTATEGVHKPRGGALAHKQIQRRADEALERNAEDVVARLNTISARFRPAVLVLAGEVQARTAIREQLPGELSGIMVETDAGGRDDNASAESLNEQLRQIAGDHSARNAQSRQDQLNEGLAHGHAVHGGEAVAQAAEMGAVDTLLLQDEATAAREAFLIKTCAGIDSRAGLAAKDANLNDGIGALLRFPLNG